MPLSDLFRTARAACGCSQRGQWAAIAPIEQPDAEALTERGAENATRSIDVSHLPPPLPMVRILETLRGLGPGETLLVHHTRRPIHLYPKLDALGCTHETTEVAPGKIQVRITNPPARP